MSARTPNRGCQRKTQSNLFPHCPPHSLETDPLTDLEGRPVPSSVNNPGFAFHSAGLKGVQGHAWLGIQGHILAANTLSTVSSSRP